MQRLFVALSLPETTVAQLADAQRSLAEMARLNDIPLRVTRADHFHVTLAFLGEVPSTRVQSIMDATREVAAAHASCQLIARGLTAFPSERKARIIANSFEDLSGTLAKLVPSLHSRLRACGCTLEDRAFHAHVTLARLPSARKVSLQLMGGDFVGATARCTSIHVFESILSSQGSEYHSLGTTELKDPEL